MKYTTPEKIENYLLIEIDNPFETHVNEWIEAVSRYMDGYAGRTLVADSADVTRYYNGDGKDIFYPDDLRAITSIEMGDEYGDNLAAVTTYDMYPKGDIGPIREISLRSGSFTLGRQNIKVTGKFGLFTTVPADIALCATMLVSELIKERLPKGSSGIKSESIGNYSVTYADIETINAKTHMLDMLQQYKKLSL